MKTNHRRGFKAKTHTDKAMSGYSDKGQISDTSVGAWVANDFTNGNRGMARAVAGAKKFVRSRLRFHDNAATKRLAQEIDE